MYVSDIKETEFNVDIVFFVFIATTHCLRKEEEGKDKKIKERRKEGKREERQSLIEDTYHISNGIHFWSCVHYKQLV